LNLCLEVLQKHFEVCSIEKKSGILGEFIDLKKYFSVRLRIIYNRKK